ncbi:protein phosphatase 2C domain-containing protein [Kitasatospora sp. NPDC088391]|uniref:protein phosphatase 2C domain-containing protein n=1 Tax=Kitasatospora sp. NPDC088391 TaxID=3364074 RepID=UPI0038099403
MNQQGAPGQPRPDDAWWHTVYAGPAGTLPDTPAATADSSTVDDWFSTAADLIGQQRTTPPPPPPPPPTAEPSTGDEGGDGATGTVPGPRPRSWAEAAWPDLDSPPAEAAEAAEAAAPTAPAGPTPTLADLPVAPPEPPSVPPRPAAPPAVEPVRSEVVLAKPAAPRPEPQQPEPQSEPEPGRAEPVAAETPAPVVPPERGAPWTGRAEPPAVPHVGERPPTYEAEPTALAPADPAGLADVVPDTAIDGARFAATTLRAVSIRGDSARYRGEPRRDALLTVRFGEGEDALVLAVLAAPARRANAQWGSAAAVEAARQLATAIGRSRAELAADLRAGARDRLRYGLQRIALQSAVRLRSAAESEDPESGPPPEETAALHCLLMSTDPAATHRAAFGTGPGGLYLLRSGHWIDAYAARLLHHPDGQPPLPPAAMPAPRPFRFRLVPATSGDILLLCTPGLAAPIAEEPAVAHFLSSHWAHPHPPGTVDFLRQIQVRAKGYADDRTAAAVWTD